MPHARPAHGGTRSAPQRRAAEHWPPHGSKPEGALSRKGPSHKRRLCAGCLSWMSWCSRPGGMRRSRLVANRRNVKEPVCAHASAACRLSCLLTLLFMSSASHQLSLLSLSCVSMRACKRATKSLQGASVRPSQARCKRAAQSGNVQACGTVRCGAAHTSNTAWLLHAPGLNAQHVPRPARGQGAEPSSTTTLRA